MWSHNIYNGTTSPSWTQNIYSGTSNNTNTITLSGSTINGVYGGYSTIIPNNTITLHGSTITLPNSTDTLVGTTVTQTLTNKTITDSTNNIMARGLTYGSGEGYVSTYTSKAPKPGQILVATSATTAEWMDIESISKPFSSPIWTGSGSAHYFSNAPRYANNVLDIDRIMVKSEELKPEINISDLVIEISI